MSILIEKGTAHHLGDCTEAILRSEIGEVYFPDESSVERFLSDGLSKGEIHVAVDEQGECLGFVWFTLNGAFYSWPYVRLIAVRPEFRGLGVGRALLAFFEEEGFKRMDHVFLLVSDFNARARKLYEQLGYRQVGVIPDLIKEGIGECIMMKSRRA